MTSKKRSLVERVWRRIKSRRRLASEARSVHAFIASYPKSGRTWFRFILSNYFNLTLNLRRDVSLVSMFNIIPNFDLDETRGMPAFHRAGAEKLPVIAAIHDRYLGSKAGRAKIIFIVRDPRDVMVSAYFHVTRHKQSFAGSFDEFLDHKERGLPALIDYLNSWAKGLPRHEHFVLTYEGLSADPFADTAAALRFLGCEVDEPALRKAVSLSSFDSMKAKEKQEGLPSHEYDRSDNEALRMRRGKAGGFRDYLTPDQIAAIEKRLGAALLPAARALVERTGCMLPRPDRGGDHSSAPASVPEPATAGSV